MAPGLGAVARCISSRPSRRCTTGCSGELEPRPGDTVLELASGTGELGFKVAGIIGDDGRLISTDFSPDMIEVARRYGAERGVENVEFRVMDAEQIDLENDSVDGVLCQSGYMLMADVEAALAETRRVLRPGRRLAMSVWGAPERNPWASIGARILVERGHMPPPEPGRPGVFSMAAEERTRALLAGARVRRDPAPTRSRCCSGSTTSTTTCSGRSTWRDRSRWCFVGCPGTSSRSIAAQLEEGFAPFG